ncbi:hypothetical protein ABZ802_13265 [Streptomyces sp. NPDC047737]|uniref:hypothetical protein n=1 Tax=unclassified Streptomyces TaxID=2593676 RepID=UPI0033CDA487
MNTLPEPYAHHPREAAVAYETLLLAARHELALRTADMRVSRRAVRRLRRARRADTYRRVVRDTQVPFRAGCAVLGTLAFVASTVMFARGHQQAADMLSAAGAFWALVVMLGQSG